MRAVVLFLTACLCAVSVPAAAVPPPPAPVAKAWLLVDYDSNAVLVEHNADTVVAPASLTKLMTAYVLFTRLHNGQLALTDTVTVSSYASSRPGSHLGLREGEQVDVGHLIEGMIVRSANDATTALAEHVSGHERQFVELMNQQAKALDLAQTHFTNSTGLDAEGHRSTARDLTQLSRRLLQDFPEEYRRWFALKETEFHNLRHANRNWLLWRDTSVDGVKTGNTETAGHCLIASAQRNGMRLIATVLGAPDEVARADAAQRLLNFGFANFETRLVYGTAKPAAEVRVWMGEQERLPLGPPQNLYLTLPRGQHDQLHAQLTLPDSPRAPIKKGDTLGQLHLDLAGRPYLQLPLVALTDIGTGNLFRLIADQFELWRR